MTTGRARITDGGSNTVDVSAKVEEVDMSYDTVMRSIDQSLKHYTVGCKRRFSLEVRDLSASDMANLRTIYNLGTSLYYYRNDDDSDYEATVRWMSDFGLLRPAGGAYHFLDRIYEGPIVLEEE